MSILPWLNIDLLRDPDPGQLRALGCHGARFALWPDLPPVATVPFAAGGIARWGIVVPQSVDWTDPAAIADFAALWAPHLDYLQAWNEPDGTGQASSTLDAITLNLRASKLIRAARPHNKALRFIAPGIIASPEYLLDVDLAPYAALDCHVYGRAQDVPYYLPRFPGSLPIWIGETWADPALWGVLTAQPRVAAIAPWLHSPPDVPDLGIQGNSDRLAAFRRLATETHAQEVPTVATLDDAQRAAYQLADATIAYNPDAAIARKWRALKSEGIFVGAPIGPEMTLGDVDGQPRAAQAFTSGAVLTWRGGDLVTVD